jgi:putative transcriptional regulator
MCYNRKIVDKSGGRNMALSYNKMWKLLIDKKMSQSELRKAADIAPNTMTKLRRDEAVNLAILGRICNVLDCDFGDIMEYVKEEVKEV